MGIVTSWNRPIYVTFHGKMYLIDVHWTTKHPTNKGNEATCMVTIVSSYIKWARSIENNSMFNRLADTWLQRAYKLLLFYRHIQYEALKTELPPSLTQGQERFVQLIYHTCCSNSTFGEDDFVSTVLMSQRISKLRWENNSEKDENKTK